MIESTSQPDTLSVIFQELEQGYTDNQIILDVLYPADPEEVREVDLLINEGNYPLTTGKYLV